MDEWAVILASCVAGVLLLALLSVLGAWGAAENTERQERASDQLVNSVRIDEVQRLKWPDGFLWGVATAAFQNEGFNYNSSWTAWSVSHNCPENARHAAGSWHFFERSDLQRAKWLNCNSFRFSLDWSRVVPSPGVVNRSALERYVRMVDACIAEHIEPVVTLCHFAVPLWCPADMWESAEFMAEHFGFFTRVVAEAMGDRVRWWVTLNEPVIEAINCYMRGARCPGKKSPAACLRAMRGMWMAHNSAWAELKRVRPDCSVSIAKNVALMRPRTRWSPIDGGVASFFGEFYNHSFIDACRTGRLRLRIGFDAVSADGPAGTLDYLGVNHYNIAHAGITRACGLAVDMAPHDAEAVDVMGWEMRPASMFTAVKDMWTRHGLPIMITEAGCVDHSIDDAAKVAHLKNTIYCLANALGVGIPVLGLQVWTLNDNFEWTEGFEPNFGLFSTNYEKVRLAVMGRVDIAEAFVPRASAHFYRNTLMAVRGIEEIFAVPEESTDLTTKMASEELIRALDEQIDASPDVSADQRAKSRELLRRLFHLGNLLRKEGVSEDFLRDRLPTEAMNVSTWKDVDTRKSALLRVYKMKSGK